MANTIVPEGIYVISETVKNPKGDRRTRGEFSRQPEYKQGQRVAIKHDTWSCEGFTIVKIFSLTGYEHYAVSKPHPAFESLLAVLKPVEATVEEWMQLNDVTKSTLAKMIKLGVVTKEQVLSAKKRDDEEDES